LSQSERLLSEIREDRLSGAHVLTSKAGRALISFLKEREHEPPEALKAKLEEFARRLTEAQPAMASIKNLARLAVKESRHSAPSAMIGSIEEFIRSLGECLERISEHGAELIETGSQVMTISSSSAVQRTLSRAKDQDKRISVICPESRPLREGVELAGKLSQLGISATICADALAPTLVSECDLVLVGGDALAPEGLVNKIGTFGLALAAREAEVPFAALISTHKFTDQFDPAWIPQMEPEELLEGEELEGVRVCNRYFDLTPLRLLTYVVTERGIISPEEARKWLRS